MARDGLQERLGSNARTSCTGHSVVHCSGCEFVAARWFCAIPFLKLNFEFRLAGQHYEHQASRKWKKTLQFSHILPHETQANAPQIRASFVQERLLAPAAADAEWLVHLDLQSRSDEEDYLLNALQPESLRRDIARQLGFGVMDMSDTASMALLADALRGNTHVRWALAASRQSALLRLVCTNLTATNLTCSGNLVCRQDRRSLVARRALRCRNAGAAPGTCGLRR